MSWSVTYIGTPENIAKALNAESERLTGDSKKEFDEALPNLVNLVKQNFTKDGEAPVLKLSASGHAYFKDGEAQFSSLNASIESPGAILV